MTLDNRNHMWYNLNEVKMPAEAEVISGVVGGLLSFALVAIPGLKDLWAAWKWKLLTMLGANILIGAAMWLLICVAKLNIPTLPKFECSTHGLVMAFYFALAAFAGNQTTYAVGTRRLQ